MLLYHFPLTSNSATPNLENKGLKNDSVIGGQVEFVEGGKLSSYSAKNSQHSERFELRVNIETTYTICFRTKVIGHWYLCEISNQLFASGNCITDDLWHDIVIVDRKLYVDGVFKSEYNYSDGLLKLGGKFSGTQSSYTGLIQDIRIYDHVLSKQEIKDYSKALVLHYPLNGSELNPSVLKDVSGFGNDLSITDGELSYIGESPRYTEWVKNSNKTTKALGYLSVSKFSVCFWYKSQDSTIAERRVFVYNNSFEIGERYGRILFGEYDSSTNRIMCDDNKSVLHFYSFTYDGTTAKSYVDGVLSENKDFFLSPFTQIQLFQSANAYAMLGSFSDLRVYASALSESDIKDLYNAPVRLDNQHTLYCSEIIENAKYKSKYWRTPTYNEMNYIINTRANASNLRGLGRVNVNGSYVNGCFILPDNCILPSGVTFTPTTANYTTNSYTIEQFRRLEGVGGVFLISAGARNDISVSMVNSKGNYYLSSIGDTGGRQIFIQTQPNKDILGTWYNYSGFSVRLVRNSSQGKFSTTTGNVDFSPANLQYHCIKHIWRFAENQYDYIGQANENISDTYNGWIDLFGYGTSGKNFSPTLHSTNNADYASGDISGTDNDWGVNEITTNEHEEKGIRLYKSGVVSVNEIREPAKYKSFAWRTPTYNEMNYIINQRPNASNLRGLGRVNVNGSYINGCFILPDNFVAPDGITFTPTTANYTTNSYTLKQFRLLESVGVVFIIRNGERQGVNISYYSQSSAMGRARIRLDGGFCLRINENNSIDVGSEINNNYRGYSIRLVRSSSQGKFSTPTGSIDFAPANLQYHCLRKVWRFAENQYDYIGAANANISDSYNGWIDLFGYGTSGVNYSPILHTTNPAAYASGNISGTDNDWGVNIIKEDLSDKISQWRTPTYNEMNYIINTRANASNLMGLGRVNIDGIFVNGCFLLPDDFVAPEGIVFTPTTANYTTNSYTLEQFIKMEYIGVVFIPAAGRRVGASYQRNNTHSELYTSYFETGFFCNTGGIYLYSPINTSTGYAVRLVRNSQQGKFSTPTGNIDFAPANLQYHCTKHIWRFAENQYDYIGAANENISDSYDGWIDLFGYGTSGVNFSPTLHTTNKADYASGSISGSGTANDWGVNLYREYDPKEFSSNGIKYNEFKEE